MLNDRYIRIKDVCEILGISRSSIYRMVQDKKFPKQIKLTERTAVWKLSAINEWVAEREKASKY